MTDTIPENSESGQPLAVQFSAGLGAWRPIETAPRDGTEVLVCRVYEHGHAEYAVAHNYGDGNGWRDMGDLGWAGMIHDEDNQPSHWMPLPAPPVSA